jgi:hypothetical protein
MTTDHYQPVSIKELPGIVGAADVDDTCLEANPDWRPDQSVDDNHFVMLCGKLVALNKGFKPTGDTLINLRNAFGSYRTPEQLWGAHWDYQCKVTHELTFEAHLKLQFEDVLQRITVEQAVEFAIKTMRPMRGFMTFLADIRDRLSFFVFVTNGADAIAQPVLNHFFGSILGNVIVHANLLQNGVFRGLHGDVGVAKGEVILSLGDVQFFWGDSKGGDGPGAEAVWRAGGHVFALGHDGDSSLADYCRSHFGDERWTYLDHYEGAAAIVHKHLAFVQQRKGTTSARKAV